MKRNKSFALLPLLSLSLSSFTAAKLNLSDFNSTKTETKKTFNYNGVECKINSKYKKDLGRRNSGLIGQYLEWEVTSYKEYNTSTNGFILYYETPMINPKAVKSFKEKVSFTLSKEYSYSFQKEEKHELSLTFGAGFGFNGIDFTSAINSKHSTTSIETYTYTYGESQTIERTYEYNFSQVPDGYVASPCIVVNAIEIEYKYTVYDNYWWGNYESRDSSEVNQTNSLLIYDLSSAYITYCIRKDGDSGKPTYYLNA